MNQLAFARKNHKLIFYGCWFLVNWVQAAGTGLLDDEAYYWVYSRFPAWGYFDHPPMIAWLIRAGYSIFQNELGVRLFIVIMSTATLRFIDLLLDEKDPKLFYTIAASMFLMQIGSIIAVPDLPLIFFIALFYLVYKWFCRDPYVPSAVALGLVISAMLYSKYHAILIIIFTIASNRSLLLRWPFWLAAAVALGLTMPHFSWQVAHGFPSLKYHLFERNASRYQMEFTTQFVFGQYLLTGPLIGWLLLWAAFQQKPKTDFQKMLKWNMAGIFGFFLLATFKGRSEANWTVPAFVAIIVLAHQYLAGNARMAAWAYRLFLPSMIIIMAARVYMIMDVKPAAWIKKDEFHKIRNWSAAIRDTAHDMPVVFVNSYQKASQYWFYTGDTSYSLNTVHYRRSNYNFWPLEQRLQGKKALLVYAEEPPVYPDSIPNERRLIRSRVADPYYSFAWMQISGKGPETANDLFSASISENSGRHATMSPYDTAGIYLALYAHDNDIAYIIPSGKTVRDLLSGDTLRLSVSLQGVKPGPYHYKWSSGTCIPGWPAQNSTSYRLNVE